MEANVIIRKYDDHRVCILPHEGFPQDYAIWVEGYAKAHFWSDLKIVQTQDDAKLLGVVCKPKTWIKLLRYFRSQGALYPPGMDDQFMNMCIDVLAGKDSDTMLHKQALSYDESKAVHEILNRVSDADFDEEKVEKDADKIIKDNEERRGI